MMRRKVLQVLGLSSAVLLLAACGNIAEGAKNTTAAQVNTGSKQAVVSERSFIYTADEGGSITKIDGNTRKVVTSIPLEGAVHNVQVSPDGKVLAATLVPSMGKEEGTDNHGDGDDHGSGHGEEMEMNGYALFYDTATDKLINKVEVGNHPAHVVFTQDGKYVLVTNNEDNDVSVIDAKTYKPVQTLPTGKGPHGFRISADSTYAYVANMGEASVSVLNLANGKEEKKIQVGKAPVTTAISKDGKTLLVPLNAENALAIVDVTTGKTVKVPVGVGPAQVFLQSDDRYAFVANQGTEKNPSQTISKIDLTTKQVVATITTGKGAHGIVTSQDNSLVYVTNMFEDTVSVIDNEKNEVVATIPVGKTPNGISFVQSNQ